MKKLLLLASFVILPLAVNAEIALQDGYAIKGKIFAVKTAKKYSSVEGCTKAALSKGKIKGFTFESNTQKCTLYKKIKNIQPKKG